MPNTNLATYIKDHFAGSEGALAVLDHLEEKHGSGPAGAMVRTLRPQFLAERDVLHKLLGSLNEETSITRRVFGWLSEKGLELKLVVDDSSGGAFHLLEAVEMLSLGVHGKRGLWVALGESRLSVPALGSVDYEALTRQADEQRALIETVRLGAAASAFAGTGA